MLNGLPIMTGVVKEIGKDKDKLNKITVTIPILDNVELEARIGYPIVGNKYGLVWSPDVGQEVLLAFPYGEINQPVIVCAMYNAKNKPPKELKKDNQDIYYKSKEGNEIVIHDEKDKSKISVTTKKGHMLIYDDKNETLVTKAKSGDNSIVFDLKKGEITLKIKKKAVVKANSDTFTVEANKGGELKSSGGKFVANCNNVQLQGKSGVKIESKATLQAKGSIFKLEGQATGSVKAGILKLN